jgi:hypothetical protein
MNVDRELSGFRAKGVPLALVVALSMIALAAIVLLAKNLFIDNAIVFHDEYIYRVWSNPTFRSSEIFRRDLAQAMPNQLYFRIYSWAAGAGGNFYAVAQWLNVVFWAVSLAALIAIVGRLGIGMDDMRLPVIVLVALLLPLSVYTKYFMPESMYLALFMLSTWQIMHLREPGALKWMATTGLTIGLMYFVKPHAVIFLGVAIIYLLVSAVGMRACGALMLGFIVGFASCRIAFPPMVSAHESSLGIYAIMLQGLASHLANYDGGFAGLARDVSHVSAGHLSLFFLMFAVPFVAVWGAACPRLGLLDTSSGRGVDPDFSRYLLIVTTIMIGLAIAFTVSAGEVGRLHSRYYFFIVPLWLLPIAQLRDVTFSRQGTIAAALLILISFSYVAFWGRGYSPILPISLVSDGPEWGFLFVSFRGAVLMLSLLFLGSALALRKQSSARLLMCAIALSSVASISYVTGQQRGIFHNDFTDGSKAMAVEQVVGTEGMSHTLIIGRDRSELSTFMFPLRTLPYVAYASAGTSTDALVGRYEDVRWVVLLSQAYEEPAGAQCFSIGARVRVCALNTH